MTAAQPKAVVETVLERPLPQNIDAEKSVLGAILLDDKFLPAAKEILVPADFFKPKDARTSKHEIIFKQMLTMHDAGMAIDPLTLGDELRRIGELEAVGGEPYLMHMIDGTPRNLEHMKRHAQIVKEKSLQRQTIHLADKIREAAFTGEEYPEVIVACAAGAFSRIQEKVQKTIVASYTAPELVALAQQPVEYIAYPFAARGMVALLDGAAKAAGKTTFILTAVGASFRQELFLNHATERVRVLLVTEENPRTLRLALERAGLTEESDLHIIPFSCLAGKPWPELVQHIERKCVDLKIGWAILDTFYAVAGLGGEEENKAGAVDAAVGPLRYIAGRLDIPITLARHERKSGGDVGNSGRGSSALTGAADIILLLKRLPGNQSLSKRQLEITGRIEQARLTVELRDGKYIVAPDEDAHNPADEAERLAQAIAADLTASVRQLETTTGIGRNRIPKLATKIGWTYGESGWERVKK